MSLRKHVIQDMQRQGPGERLPTWWFKYHVAGYDTPDIRAELQRMEREGLVAAERSQSNNTLWQLVVGKEKQ